MIMELSGGQPCSKVGSLWWLGALSGGKLCSKVGSLVVWELSGGVGARRWSAML